MAHHRKVHKEEGRAMCRATIIAQHVSPFPDTTRPTYADTINKKASCGGHRAPIWRLRRPLWPPLARL
jgi:hypothetical protein